MGSASTVAIARCLADVRSRHRLDLQATVASTGLIHVGDTTVYRATVRDTHGPSDGHTQGHDDLSKDVELDLLFLGRAHIGGLEVGRTCLIEGRAALQHGRLVVWNPRYELLAAPLPQARLAEVQATRMAARSVRARRQRVSAEATLSAADSDVEPAGRFRIYLGPAAGVGKTFAMLDEAHRRRQRGKNVVVGIVETHGRPATAAQLEDLDVVPPKVVHYRNAEFHELDLDAVLERRPDVVVVDELAHTNVPGSGRHEKRWQDVLELLDAGICVLTTLNAQHIESLADVAEASSGVTITERVPDAVLARADQIELVDSSPEQLRRRMLHGNIYPPERARQALQSFFRTDTLAALRELTLRYLADDIDEDLLERVAADASSLRGVAERILVGVSTHPGADTVIRRAARIAARVKADLYAVRVHDADAPDPDRQTLADLHRLADDLGATWIELPGSPVSALLGFAQQHQVTQIVLGRSQRTRWQRFTGGGSTTRRLTWHAISAGIDVHIVARDQANPQTSPGTTSTGTS